MKYQAAIFLACLLVIQVTASDKGTREIANIGGRDYLFGAATIPYTAYGAAIACNREGMKLVSLQTLQKENLIRDYMKSSGMTGDFWTSGVRYVDGGWIWSGSGDLITAPNWGPNEPSIAPELHSCINISSEPLWKDQDCENKYGLNFGYICEFGC